MELTVKVEKTSPIQRKLTIKVPAQTVTKHFEKGLLSVQKTAKLKGFRPGMVPLPVVRQMFGADVRHQVYHDLIDETFQRAIREEKLRAVGSPQIETPDHKTGEGEHDHEIRENQDFTFIATVEILPELEVKGYTGLALTQNSADVKDADVDTIINRLLDSQAQLEPVTEERTVVKGDYVDLEFDGGLKTEKGLDKRPGMKGKRMLEIGSDTLIPGFEEQLVGMRRGETKTIAVRFPAEYHDKSFENKDAEFVATIHEVKAKKLPTLDDELAKTMGYEGVKDMRTKAREHLETEQQQEVERKLKSDLLAQIIEKNPFEVPASLIQAQTRALAQDVGSNLKNQGFSEDMIQEALTGELDNLKKRAENQVRASLLLEAIAKKEAITVATDAMDAEIRKMAENMKVEEARVREFYEKNPQRRDDLEFRLREDRTMAFLIEKAKVKKA